MKAALCYAAGLALTLAVVRWLYDSPDPHWWSMVMAAFLYGWFARSAAIPYNPPTVEEGAK